jgi:hypothetical protein
MEKYLLDFFRKTCPLRHHYPTIQVFFETDYLGLLWRFVASEAGLGTPS